MCPHHQCSKCFKKRGSAGGVLFPCHGCANSYCEECLPNEGVTFLDKLERFDKLGFDSTKHNVYINCSHACEKYAQVEFGYVPCKQNQRKERIPCPEAIDLSGHFGGTYDINEEMASLDADKEMASGRGKRNVSRVNYSLGRPSKTSTTTFATASHPNQSIITTPKLPNPRKTLGSTSKSTPSTTATDVSSETSSYCSVVDLTGETPNLYGNDVNHAIEIE